MNLKEFDIVTESIGDGTVTLYHGSANLYKTLEPVALDFGNAFQKPGWSLFCFKKKDIAISWAIMRTLYQLLREMKRRNKEINQFNDFFIWNGSKCKLIINGGRLYELVEYMEEVPMKGYVYALKPHISHISFGNDSAHPEYTVRENHIKPTEISTIQLSKSNITKYCDIIDEDQYIKFRDNIKNQWSWMSRGLLSLLITNDWSYNLMENTENVKKIRDDISAGILKPGDDLEKYMTDKGIRLMNISPLKRIKLQMTGLKKGREY